MKAVKTVLSFLLVFCMMTSVCGLTAFADVNFVTSGEGSGTQLGILEGSANISYTDSSGGPHVPPDPGGPHVPPDPGVSVLDPGVPALNPGVPESIVPDLGSGVPSLNPGPVENNYNTGDVQSSAPSSEAVISSTVNITVNTDGTSVTSGAITVDSGSPSATIDGVEVTYTPAAGGDPDTVSIDGGVSAQDKGIRCENSGGNITVNVGTEDKPADITASSESVSRGVVVINKENCTGTTTVNVSGNVTADGINSNSIGVMTNNRGNGSTMVVNIGDDSNVSNVTGTLRGMQIANYDGSTEVSVSGNVTGDNLYGLETINSLFGSKLTVEIGGDVSGTGAGSTGLRALDASGSSTVTIGGNITGDASGISVGGIRQRTDVTVVVGTADNPDSGIVTSGITLEERADASNISITLWQTDAPEKGSVLNDIINYIVRLVKPAEEEGTLSVTTEKGLTVKDINGKNMTVAQAGEKITLDITAKDGYEVESAFVGEGVSKKPLDKDENGNFFYRVERGGGILLSALFKKNAEPEPQPEPKPDPKPKSEPVTVVVSYANAKFTFDLDGGTMDGETGKVTKWYFPGQTMELPEAPTKEGFSFAGWETVVKGEKVVLQPGDLFKVNGAQSFTALWTKG